MFLELADRLLKSFLRLLHCSQFFAGPAQGVEAFFYLISRVLELFGQLLHFLLLFLILMHEFIVSCLEFLISH